MFKAALSFSFPVVLYPALFFAFCSCAAFPEETAWKLEDGKVDPVWTEDTIDVETDGDFPEETKALNLRDKGDPTDLEETEDLDEVEGDFPAEKNDWAEDADDDNGNEDEFEDTNHDWAEEEDEDETTDKDDDAKEIQGDSTKEQNDFGEGDDDEGDGDFPEETAMEQRDGADLIGANEANEEEGKDDEEGT